MTTQIFSLSCILACFRAIRPVLFLCLLTAFYPVSLGAQEPPADTAPEEAATDEETPEEAADEETSPEESEDEPPSIEDILKDSEAIHGLFSLYRDTKTGELRLLLDQDDLDQDYLYFAYSENGVPAAGHFRGSFNVDRAKLFHISRYYDRVEFIIENTNFYFDPDKAISNAADANISHAITADMKIEAEDEENGRLLIQVNDLFLSEAFNPVAPLPNPDTPPTQSFRLGGLDSGKTKIRDIRNYEENTDVIVEYVYKNDQPYVSGGDEVTDPRFVSILIQHSLIKAPENDYVPRYDDPRVGYFMGKVTDLSSTEVTPYRDIINRWHLVKQNPDAEISDPVEPIVYWIENTTPMELRPIIEAAALRWNEAFESAGFSNALEIRTQPADADWDAGDIRYNVLRWASSPDPQFGGYGPSFFDPRTGQILGADIMLEHSVISNYLSEARVMGDSALFMDSLEAMADDPAYCVAGKLAHQEFMFGMAALEALGAETEDQERLLEEFMHFLILHEIGHTLGLNHNMHASHLHSLEAIFDPEQTYDIGLYGSVMDYPAVPFAMPGEPQGQFWITRPGPYDHWAIEFGYSDSAETEEAEAARMASLLSRSTEPELAFGNDADDMRNPGKAIDPRVMIYDLTSDPIGFAQHQINVVNAVASRLPEKLTEEGESYQELLNGFSIAASRYQRAAGVASRFIGGVYVDRGMVGQQGAGDPFTPVSLDDQVRAMQLLRENVFAPDAFETLTESANLLLAQRRGFDHYGHTEDPKLHSLAERIQNSILDHLLHPNVMTRLTDSRLYGNEYAVADMLVDLTDAIFEEDMNTEINTFRQNLQLNYVDRLTTILNDANGHNYVTRSMALDRLRWIEDQFDNNRRVSLETQAHREHIVYRIQQGLDKED